MAQENRIEKIVGPSRSLFLLGILGFFVYVLAPFLSALLLGLLLAASLAGLNHRIGAFCHLGAASRALATTCLFSVGVLLPVFLILIFVGKELVEIGGNVQELADEFAIFWQDFKSIAAEWLPISTDNLPERIRELASGALKGLATFSGKLLGSMPKFFIDVLILVMTLFYALKEGHVLEELMSKLWPLTKKEYNEFRLATMGILRGVIAGSLVSGLAQGLLVGMGYLIFGVPKAFLFGAITAFLSLVPFLGCGPTAIGGAIYLFAQGEWGGAAGMIGVLIIAASSDNFIKPWILSGEAELHPLLGLLGALGGLAAFGFIGLLLGPLVMALGVIALRLFSQIRK